MPGLLILLACRRCALPSIDDPHTAKALVQNAVAIYEQDDLLNAHFYSDDNVIEAFRCRDRKALAGGRVAGANWNERIYTTDFVNMKPPTRVWPPDMDIPPVSFEP